MNKFNNILDIDYLNINKLLIKDLYNYLNSNTRITVLYDLITKDGIFLILVK